MKRNAILRALSIAIITAGPCVAQAQGTVRGAEEGAARGNEAAGPIGGIVGGAVGAVTGTVGGILGVEPSREREIVIVPAEPRREREIGSSPRCGANARSRFGNANSLTHAAKSKVARESRATKCCSIYYQCDACSQDWG